MVIGTRVLDLEERAQKAAEILSGPQKITDTDHAAVHSLVFPRLNPSPADIRLQMGQRMPRYAVRNELGISMEPVYTLIYDYLGFERMDRGQFSAEPGLHRHLWDTAWRANLFGLPLRVKMAALLHDVPEFAGHGVPQSVEAINRIGGYIKAPVLEDLAYMTKFSAVVIRDFFRTAQRRNRSLSTLDYPEILQGKMHRASESRSMQRMALPDDMSALVAVAFTTAEKCIREAIEAIHSPEKMMVPTTSASNSDWVMEEAIARANPYYASTLYQYSKGKLAAGDPEYDTILLIKALAYIDRMRTTMGDFSRIERSTREATDFTENLDLMLLDLEAAGKVNNYLTFLSRALRTITIATLRRGAVKFGEEDDTAPRYGGTVLETRLEKAKRAYNGVVSLSTDLRSSSPSAQS